MTLNVAAVNDAPTATGNSYATPQDTPLNVPAASGVLGNDNDIDGPSLTAVISSPPANGFLNLNPDGSFNYSPNAGYTGIETFTYRASDGSRGTTR